jgi:hypothetical protein
VDTDQKPGLTTESAQELREMLRKCRELERNSASPDGRQHLSADLLATMAQFSAHPAALMHLRMSIRRSVNYETCQVRRFLAPCESFDLG